MDEDIVLDLKKNSIIKSLEQGERMDGRKFDEYRKVEVKEGYIPKAEGSALVKLGETQVLVGVKMDIGTPYPDHETEGNMVTNSELVPIASPEYYSGPPTPTAIEFARVVDRGIRESGAIEFDKMCITEGEKVWTALIDLHVLDFDGNFYDAATIGAVKALWNTRLPKYDAEKDMLVKTESKGKLPMKYKPITATFAKIGDSIVLDPSLVEEKVSDAMMLLSIRDDGHLSAAQKMGKGAFTIEEINQMFETAVKATKKIRKLI